MILFLVTVSVISWFRCFIGVSFWSNNHTFTCWLACTSLATTMQPAMTAADLLAQLMSPLPHSTPAAIPFLPPFSLQLSTNTNQRDTLSHNQCNHRLPIPCLHNLRPFTLSTRHITTQPCQVFSHFHTRTRPHQAFRHHHHSVVHPLRTNPHHIQPAQHRHNHFQLRRLHNNINTISTCWSQHNFHRRPTTLRMFRGRPRQAAMVHRQIRVGDIYKICELSLQASIFTHMNHTFQQVRGSAIGNQISPVLANITVSHVEHQWRTQPQIQLLQQRAHRIYTTRYVDNKLVLPNKSQHFHDGMQQFLTDTFYEPPVLLEQEPDLSSLGCTINPDLETLSYIQPTSTWQFQPYSSAASKQHKLSAAYSRICLAARHSRSHPQQQAKATTRWLALVSSLI